MRHARAARRLSDAAAIAIVLLSAGLLGPPTLVARSLALADRLPPPDRASGYSILSAASGIGTSAAGLVTAPLLTDSGPALALVAVLGISVTAAGIAGLGGRHPH